METEVRPDENWEQETLPQASPDDVKNALLQAYDSTFSKISSFFPYLDTTKAQTVALFTASSWVVRSFTKFPLLHITGVKGSGKSVLATILSVNAEFKHYMNPTVAVLFRSPTKRIIIDECESLDDDKVTVLNAAHQKGIKVPRLKSNAGETEIMEFEPYGAYVIAGIKSRFPASLMSRLIQVPLRPFRWTSDIVELDLIPGWVSILHRDCRVVEEEIYNLYRDTPTQLRSGRFRDCYRALLVMGQYLGVDTVNLMTRLKEEQDSIEDDESYTEMEVNVIKFLDLRVKSDSEWVKMGEIAAAVGLTTNFYPLREALSRLTFTRKKRNAEGFHVHIIKFIVSDTLEKMLAF